MSQPSRFQEIRVGFGENPAATERPDSNQSFRILLMGDFSGRASRSVCQTDDLATRRVIEVDRDNFDDCLARLKVTLRVPLAGDQADAELTFNELDDFGPDRIYDELELFASLRKLRRRLANNNSFAEAAEEVKKWKGVATDPSATEPAPKPTESDDPEADERSALGADLLAASLDATPKSQTGSGPKAADWDALVQQIVEPYVLPGKDPRQDEFLAIVDQAISDQMREVLHRPEVKQLEAAWRSVYFVTRRIETDSSLKIFLLDVSHQELAADLAAVDSPAKANIYKNLVEQTVGTSGGQPWGALVTDYQFAATEADADLLARLAIVANAAGAPLLAAADHSHISAKAIGGLGDPDDWESPSSDGEAAWQELRELPEAAYVCLTFPGVLSRLPFGKKTKSAEQFDFEETTKPPKYEQLLWASGAYFVAIHLAETFGKAGWSMQPPPVTHIGNLPVFVYDDGVEKEALPCAEAYLIDRAADRIRMQGLTPIRSLKNADAVQIGGMRSLSNEMAELRGRWS